MKNFHLHFQLCLTIFFCFWRMLSLAQESDTHQAYIDQLSQQRETRSETEPTIIDLSAYPTPRTSTLHIRGGVSVILKNGSLLSDDSFTDAPLVDISEESVLTLAEDASIIASRIPIPSLFIEVTPSLVEIISGSLILNGGLIDPIHRNSSPQEGKRNTKVVVSSMELRLYTLYPRSILMSSPHNCNFIMNGGTVTTDVDNTLTDNEDKNSNDISIGSNSHLSMNISTYNNLSISSSATIDGCIDLKGSGAMIKMISGQAPSHVLAIKGVQYNQTVITSSSFVTLPGEWEMALDSIWIMDDYKPELQVEKINTGGVLTYRYSVNAADWESVREFNENIAHRLAYISEANREITTAVTVSGQVNGSGIAVLRQMGAKKLESLNLANAYIVNGGAPYYQVSMSHGGTMPQTYSYYTENDTISYGMFRYCTALKEIWLPKGVRVIENEAFYGCTNLSQIHGLTDVEDIRGESFHECPALTNFDLTGNVHLVIEDGIIYDHSHSKLFTALQSIVSGEVILPSTLTSINSSAFAGCTFLTNVIWPKNLTTIPGAMFSGCKSLTEFKFPSTLTTIESSAFYGCNLSIIHLPTTLTEIGSGAFANNPLTNISCEATSPPHITEYYNEETGLTITPIYLGGGSTQSRTFEGVNVGDVTLHLHKNCTEAYQASQNRTAWLVFSNMVEDLTSDPLQDLIDDLSETGTSENPVELPFPDSGIVGVEEGDVDICGNLQLVISGSAWASYASLEMASPQPVVHMPGGNINVAAQASLTLQNVSLTAALSDNHLKINGTLIIEDDVKASQFKNFIELEEGSQLIWKSGTAEATEKVIQNDGGSALFEDAIINGLIKNKGSICVENGTYNGGETSALINTEGNVTIKGGKWTGGKGFNNANSHNDSEEVQAKNEQDHIIANHGHLSIEGGSFGVNGNGSIWTDSDIDINGQAELGSIYIRQGNQINLTGKMTNSYAIHIQHDEGEEIATGVVVTGSNGYKITQEDANQFAIELPEGYYSKYDEVNNTIAICSYQEDAVNGIGNQMIPNIMYDLSGRIQNQKKARITISKGKKFLQYK